MLQHNAYSRDAWMEARNMVAQFIGQGVSPAEMRRQSRQRLDSGHRTWSIVRGAKLDKFDTITWSRTIADIRFDSPDIYCADVERWAMSVVKDTEGMVHELIKQGHN
jgi:hypothetical protein